MSEETPETKIELKKEDRDLVALLLAIIFPPLGVLLKEGLNVQLLLNIVLTLLGWLPGIIHALYLILKK